MVVPELAHLEDATPLDSRLMRKLVRFNPDLSRISEGVNTSLGFGYGSHFVSTDFGGSSCLDGRPESSNRLHYTQQSNFSDGVDLYNSYGSIIVHRQNPHCDRNLHDSPGPSSFQEYAENPGHLNASGAYTPVPPSNPPTPEAYTQHFKSTPDTATRLARALHIAIDQQREDAPTSTVNFSKARLKSLI